VFQSEATSVDKGSKDLAEKHFDKLNVTDCDKMTLMNNYTQRVLVVYNRIKNV